MNSDEQQTRFDIAIVGAGMTGAALAIALADTGLSVVLLDGTAFDPGKIPCNSDTSGFDPRVSAIAPASEAFLAGLGVWQAVLDARCCPYVEMDVWDADGTGRIHFDARSIHEDHLGTIVENSVILQALHGRLETLSGIRLVAPERVEVLHLAEAPDVAPVRVETAGGRSFEATLLVGADGPRSVVRQLGNFETREWAYGHDAIVASVRTQLPHRNTALQRFMGTGPLAFLPLPECERGSDLRQRHSSIVWSAIPTRAEELMSLDDEQFRLTLGRAIEHRLGKVEEVDRRFRFPLQQRHAVDYVKPGLALIGDAAHTLHPLAGQGVNLGFADARVLAEVLQDAVRRGRSPGDLAVLRRYQRRRVGHNLGMMGLMEGFKFLFARDEPAIRWLRNAGMSGIDQLNVVKHRLMREAGFRGR